MPIHWTSKGPNELVDPYGLDWSSELNAGETIASSSWAIVGNPTSLTINNDAKTATTTSVFLSGGRLNATYKIVNTITTSLGRTTDASATLTIKED